MGELLNSRLGSELVRILVDGVVFTLGMLFGWVLGILKDLAGFADWRSRGEAREVLTMEKILLESRPDGGRSCAYGHADETRSTRCFPTTQCAMHSSSGSGRRSRTNRWSRWRKSWARTCFKS